MDINRVRYFNVFAETGSLVKASEILHLSQPALSKALRALESETGLRLVEADGRGLKLTKAGQQFRNESAQLLEHWLSLPKKIQDQQILRPTRIASFEVFTTHFLGRLLDFTELEGLEIHELLPGKIEQAVAEERVDMGITYVPIPQSGVEFVEAGKIKMAVFGLEKFRSKRFADLPFVVPLSPLEGAPSKVVGLDGWPDHKISRAVKFRVTLMESALELCRRGVAVAYLPEFIVALQNRLAATEYRLKEISYPLAQRTRLQSVYLVKRHDRSETALYRQVARCIRSL